MKSILLLSAALFLICMGTSHGFDTDGRSRSTVTTPTAPVPVRQVVVLQPRTGSSSSISSGSGTTRTTGPIGAMGTNRPAMRPAGPIGAMGSGSGSMRPAGPIGAMGAARPGMRPAGPIGAMGSTTNTSRSGPVGAMGTVQNSNLQSTVTRSSGPTNTPCTTGSTTNAGSTGTPTGGIVHTSDRDYSRLAKVQWGYSVRAMKAAVETTEEPFAIFFCSEETAKYTGGGKEAYADYLESFPGRPTPTTVFDERPSVEALQAAGVQKFVRVTTTQENRDLMRTYRASAGSETLVVCGFNGDPLITLRGEDCVQSQVTGAMKDFPARYKQWKLALQEKLDRESQTQRPKGSIEIMKWE